MRDDFTKFERVNAVVYGVNFAAPDQHKKYADKYKFNFPLLSDSELAVCALYDAKKGDKGIARTVVIVDKEGMVRYEKKGMPSDEELLETLAKLK